LQSLGDPSLQEASRRLKIRPILGVRAKLSSKGVGRWGRSAGDRAKFGLAIPEILSAVEQLKQADMLDCLQLLHFHIGSQISAISVVKDALREACQIYVELCALGAKMGYLDVGGGFPATYGAPPALDCYGRLVEHAFEEMMVLESAELWSEPGRALVAEAESLLVRIDGAKDGALYLNDGGFGALYDAVNLDWPFPVRALSPTGEVARAQGEYTLYGPTCDSADRFARPVTLPAGLSEGDYLEFGNIGAYGRAMASRPRAWPR